MGVMRIGRPAGRYSPGMRTWYSSWYSSMDLSMV